MTISAESARHLTASPELSILPGMSYPGGKAGAGVYQHLINLMPGHEIYIEPFLGGGAILARKKPAGLNIGIDLDPEAVRAYRRTNPESESSQAREFRYLIGDGISFLKGYPFDARPTLVYCDPPYLMSTRRRKDRLYKFEMDDERHYELLRLLKTLPAMVMISGYPSELYSRELRSWKTATFNATNRAGTPIIEFVWFNYSRPLALHDYRFLGENFRERERLKRKTARWTARLRRLPPFERFALMHAIEQAFSTGNAEAGSPRSK